MAYTNWKDRGNPFLGFTEEITYEWMRNGFDREGTKKWLNAGMKTEDAGFCSWLRDKVKIEPLEILNNMNTENNYQEVDLREQYKEYSRNNKLSEEIIEKIKGFKQSYDTSKNLTQEQELLINELIIDEELRNRYKKYRLCKKCNQPNTGYVSQFTSIKGYCSPCNFKNFQKDFKNWTSGNPEIDEFIQGWQMKVTNLAEVIEWIPYGHFGFIEYLAEGGFGKVYKAEWLATYPPKWKRELRAPSLINDVVLKSLNGSQNMTIELLQEITYHKLIGKGDNFNSIVRCYGISQHPETKNYVMVMEYISGGDLRQYLKKNFGKLEFKEKICQSWTIANGLNKIYAQELIHRDLHPGNILKEKWGDRKYKKYTVSYITDLGLCRPANETDNSKVYGVLPYVAPEVLQGQLYTQASDIYSFGIVVYEMLTGLPPYVVYDTQEKCYKETVHNDNLALAICRGYRPNLDAFPMPQLLKDLINKCWDADLEKRPNASDLDKVLFNWWREIVDEKDTEFVQQYKEIILKSEIQKTKSKEEMGVLKRLLNKLSPTTKRTRIFAQINPQAIYTSRLLDFKNLPKPQNSREINEQFYKFSQSVKFDTNEFNKFWEKEQGENQFQSYQEIPPKNS